MEKFIEDEQVLPPGAPLLAIGDLSSIEVEADILSEEIGVVRVGQGVEISGKALGGKIVHGKVKTIYPSGFKKISSLGIEQQRVKTLIAFDNSDIGLRPEVSVDVKIIIAESPDALRILAFDCQTKTFSLVHEKRYPYGETTFDTNNSSFYTRGQFGDAIFEITKIKTDAQNRLWVTDFLSGKLFIIALD